ncbi:MAG: hypothetical protein ACK5X3_10625, partial [Pseudomonadota bacterium]
MIQDPRQMGDAELDAAIARLQGGQAPRPASPASPVAQMSDAELDAASARAQSQTPHPTARQAPAQAPADP